MRKSTSLKRGNFMSAWIVVPPTVRLRMFTSAGPAVASTALGGAAGARLDDRILPIPDADRRFQLVVAVARDRHAGRRIVEAWKVVVAGLDDQHLQAGAWSARSAAAEPPAPLPMMSDVEAIEAGIAENVGDAQDGRPIVITVEAERAAEP